MAQQLVPGFPLDHRHSPGLRVRDGRDAAGGRQDVGDQVLWPESCGMIT